MTQQIVLEISSGIEDAVAKNKALDRLPGLSDGLPKKLPQQSLLMKSM
ncbi:MAG: hypothetical protein ACOH5I_22845 [Oligoflexus sp.]